VIAFISQILIKALNPTRQKPSLLIPTMRERQHAMHILRFSTMVGLTSRKTSAERLLAQKTLYRKLENQLTVIRRMQYAPVFSQRMDRNRDNLE